MVNPSPKNNENLPKSTFDTNTTPVKTIPTRIAKKPNTGKNVLGVTFNFIKLQFYTSVILPLK